MEKDSYLLSLPDMSQALRLPEKWLKAEADGGHIPHLKIGKRYRFNREAVVATLARRAAMAEGTVPHAR